MAETASTAGLSKVDDGRWQWTSHTLARSHPGAGSSPGSKRLIKCPVAEVDGGRRWSWGSDRSGYHDPCQLYNDDIPLPYGNKVGFITPDHVVAEGVGVVVAAGEKPPKYSDLVNGADDGGCQGPRELELM